MGEQEEQDYVTSQIIGDKEVNVDMEGVEKIEDFEFLDFDISELNDSWVEPPLEKDK